MPTLRSEASNRRRASTHTAPVSSRTRSASQQGPLPRRPSLFIVSSSRSSSNSRRQSSVSRRARPRNAAIDGMRSPPAATAPAWETTTPAVIEETIFWPNVLKYIDNIRQEGGSRRIKPTCPICYDELPVRGLNQSEELLQHDGGLVIGCGHMFCRECLVKSLRGQRQLKLGRSCPICRTAIQCPRCGVHGAILNIPREQSDPEELPRIGIDEGENAALCLRCEAREWWIGKVERGRHGLPHRDKIVSDFQMFMYHMMERMEDDGVAMGIVEVEQQLLVLLKENFMRLFQERERQISRYISESTRQPWSPSRR
ncbi:hypothetical protein V8C35DRAFT_326846 [Trichoderma chlorosporum]